MRVAHSFLFSCGRRISPCTLIVVPCWRPRPTRNKQSDTLFRESNAVTRHVRSDLPTRCSLAKKEKPACAHCVIMFWRPKPTQKKRTKRGKRCIFLESNAVTCRARSDLSIRSFSCAKSSDLSPKVRFAPVRPLYSVCWRPRPTPKTNKARAGVVSRPLTPSVLLSSF
jgi:hypothetical protein